MDCVRGFGGGWKDGGNSHDDNGEDVALEVLAQGGRISGTLAITTKKDGIFTGCGVFDVRWADT